MRLSLQAGNSAVSQKAIVGCRIFISWVCCIGHKCVIVSWNSTSLFVEWLQILEEYGFNRLAEVSLNFDLLIAGSMKILLCTYYVLLVCTSNVNTENQLQLVRYYWKRFKTALMDFQYSLVYFPRTTWSTDYWWCHWPNSSLWGPFHRGWSSSL